MKTTVRLTLRLVLVALWLTLLAPPGVSAATMTISPGEKPAWFEVQATGFDELEIVTIGLTGPQQQQLALPSYAAAATGDLAFNFRMAPFEAPGQWTLALLGETSGLVLTDTFVMPTLSPDIDLVMAKTVGPAGTRYDFASRDFAALEWIQYRLIGPDEQVFLSGRLSATKIGSADFTAFIDSRLPSGLWRMSAYGTESEHYGLATFSAGGRTADAIRPITGPPSLVTITAGDTPGWFTLATSAFGRHEDVTAMAIGPEQQQLGLPQQTSNENGQVAMVFQMPRSAEPGTWTISLTGISSERTLTGTLFMPLLGPDRELIASPTTGSGATSISVTGTDFATHETITYWLKGPDGHHYAPGTIEATHNGNISFDITIEAGLPSGVWFIYAYGTTSDHLGVAAVTIT